MKATTWLGAAVTVFLTCMPVSGDVSVVAPKAVADADGTQGAPTILEFDLFRDE